MRPEDDYTHPIGPELHFNESMYFHFFDPRARLGGFVRLANRPNEGKGERTVCLYLPDGRLAFDYAQPEISSNESFDAAGLQFSVRELLRRLDINFDGTVSVVDKPSAMDHPKVALNGSPTADCAITLEVAATAPPFEHSFDTDEGSFAPNHYEQLVRYSGEVRLDGVSTSLLGHGLRDHSWGPRYWQTPWFYRWLHGSGDGLGFMGAWFGRPDGSALTGGFVHDGTVLHEVEHLDITTARDNRDEQVAIAVSLRVKDREWKLRGDTLATVPLRNRRDDGAGQLAVTRIVEGLMRWTLEDGRVVYGMSEYLDQVVDGRPVGLNV